MVMAPVRAARITPELLEDLFTVTAALLLGALFTVAFPEIVAASATWFLTVTSGVHALLVAPVLDQLAATVGWLVAVLR